MNIILSCKSAILPCALLLAACVGQAQETKSPGSGDSAAPQAVLTGNGSAADAAGAGNASIAATGTEIMILRGRAEEKNPPLSVSRLESPAALAAAITRYRLRPAQGQKPETPVFGERNWWLVIPPRQEHAGFTLTVRDADAGQAAACLQAPEGAAAAVISTPAFLVGLPLDTRHLNWLGTCG